MNLQQYFIFSETSVVAGFPGQSLPVKLNIAQGSYPIN